MSRWNHLLKWCAALATVAATAVPAQAVTAIAPADILLQADATMPFRDARWWVQCDGQKGDLPRISESGIAGRSVDNLGTATKFGKVPSPSGSGAKVLLFRAQPNNAYHGGSPRCEMAFRAKDQYLPRNQVFWHAFSLWIDDWSRARDLIAVSQWYHGMTGAGLNPPFVIVAKGNSLSGDVRSSQAQKSMTKADQDRTRVFDIRGGFYRKWLNFVIQAKVSPNPADAGFMKVWINGEQVADYHGPIGYAVPGAREVVVHGNYPLIKGNVPFDLTLPVRDVYMGKSLVVSDPTGRYVEEDLRRVLEAVEATR